MLRKPASHSECGAAILLFATIFPLLMLLAGLVLDMSIRNLDREDVQQRLDEAALTAARYLPHTDYAKRQAEEYFHQRIRPTPQDTFTANTTRDSVKLHMRRPTPAPFLIGAKNMACTFFSSEDSRCGTDNEVSQIWYEARSSARINTKDIAIFFDNSSYLAPRPTNSVYDVWAEDTKSEGPPIDTCLRTCSSDRCRRECNDGVRHGRESLWPTADLFKQTGALPADAIPLVHRRILTQQCFNNIYSPIKELAIRLYERHGANTGNQVGVFAGPGATGRIVQIKPMSPGGGTMRGNFEYYQTPGGGRPYSSDERCFALAEREVIHIGYQFPNSSSSLGFLPTTNNRISAAEGTVPKERADLISVQQAIWSRAVQHSAGGNDKRLNIKKALETVGKQLIGAPIYSSRGNLSDEISSSAYFILGDFPHIGSNRFPHAGVKENMREALSSLDDLARDTNRKVTLFFIVTRHFGNYGHINGCINPRDHDPQGLGCDAFFEDSDTFSSFINRQNRVRTHLNLVFFRVPDRGSLATDFLHLLTEVDKAVILER